MSSSGETNYTPRTSKVKLALLQEDLWRIATGAEKQPGPWYDKEDNERSPTAPEQQQLDKWTTRATRASTIILLALEDGPYEHVSDMASEETPEPQPGHMAPSAPNSPVAKYRKTMTVPTVEHCPPLQVKKLSPKGRAPTRGSAFAAGYDIYSAHDTTIPARGKALVDTGIAVAVPAGTYGRIAPRSGLSSKHFIDTGAGVIDADYRGPGQGPTLQSLRHRL
ncbi:MAG: Deoxyuridine 5'-triphosphate nucleotidohydrolase [Geoglossum simile]|nr:MAG: Deoxyuridine 5'-triphosphate nucleotidohydrolase [Geoglossum simile]